MGCAAGWYRSTTTAWIDFNGLYFQQRDVPVVEESSNSPIYDGMPTNIIGQQICHRDFLVKSKLFYI